ncbi:hypothetical protein CPB84DRAFT_1799541, partial [Gymnopilus junonius]
MWGTRYAACQCVRAVMSWAVSSLRTSIVDSGNDGKQKNFVRDSNLLSGRVQRHEQFLAFDTYLRF